jgi:hypothetical protein
MRTRAPVAYDRLGHGTLQCHRRAELREAPMVQSGHDLNPYVARYIGAELWSDGGRISLHLRSARRQAGRDRAERAGRAGDRGSCRHAVCARHGDNRGHAGMGGDPRGDGAATCKIAGIVCAGHRPPRYQQWGIGRRALSEHCCGCSTPPARGRTCWSSRDQWPRVPACGVRLACLVDVANAWHIVQIESPSRAPCHRGRQGLRGRSC